MPLFARIRVLRKGSRPAMAELTTDIHGVFRVQLKGDEPNAEMGQKGRFFKDLWRVLLTHPDNHTLKMGIFYPQLTSCFDFLKRL